MCCWTGVTRRLDRLRPKILRTTLRIDPFLWPGQVALPLLA
jgi:hypothetical protein